MNMRYSADDFVVRPKGTKKIRVIDIIPDQIVTREWHATPKVVEGRIVPDTSRDILKMVVVERHRATGNVGVGFVRGFKLKRGAIGSSVAHDAHNVVVAGTNDADILRVLEEVERLQGGQVAVVDGRVKAELPLPIAGLVTDQPLRKAMKLIDDLNAAARAMGCGLSAPFMALSFLSLSPIPSLKLTDQGLIDAAKLQKTDLFV
jgi:adenine deaminase